MPVAPRNIQTPYACVGGTVELPAGYDGEMNIDTGLDLVVSAVAGFAEPPLVGALYINVDNLGVDGSFKINVTQPTDPAGDNSDATPTAITGGSTAIDVSWIAIGRAKKRPGPLVGPTYSDGGS